jgi:hypothetical protein
VSDGSDSVGIHRRHPQRLGVHLAKTLVAVDRHPFPAQADEVLDELVERLHPQRTGVFLGRRADRRHFAARLQAQFVEGALLGGAQLAAVTGDDVASLVHRLVVARITRRAQLDRTLAHRSHDIANLRIAAKQRPILAGRDEIHADVIDAGVAVGSILDP